MTAIFNFLMIAGAVQGFIFNIATFLSRKKIEKPVLFLNLFVFFLSMNNLQSWFLEKRFLPDDFFLDGFAFPWYVLIVPMFYSFLIHYLEIENKLPAYLRLSLTIFSLELMARMMITWLVNTGTWPEPYLAHYNNLEDTITLGYSIWLYYKALQIVFRYRPPDSFILDFDDLRWLKWFFYLGAGVFVLWMMSIVFNVTGLVNKPYSYYPLRLGSSILIYWVGYQAFFRYVVLKDRIRLRKAIRKDQKPDRLDGRREERGEIAFSELDAYVVNDQKYLDPQLSLESLSKDIHKSVSSVSKLLNAHAGCSFPDYINRYRVEQAKKLLGDLDFFHYTIVAIGLECGFNSKSTFYTAFKKFCGMTPSAYRKQCLG